MAFGRRPEPSSSNSLADSPSHFFKVILPSALQDKKLSVPDKFARNFGDELSDVATLIVPNGRMWQVRLTKHGNKVWFDDGWDDFVKYHSICVGYFFVFKYGKNSTFHVLIFDTTACEIQYPYYVGGLENDKSIVHRDELTSDKSVEQMVSKIRNKRSKIEELDEIRKSDAIGDENEFKMADCKVEAHSSDEDHEITKFNRLDLLALLKDIGVYAGKRFHYVSAEEKGRAISAARLFKPKNPSFMVILRPGDLQRARVVVPTKFAKICLSSESKWIKVEDASGSEWPAQTVWYDQSCYMINLRGLLKEKNLRMGDICMFELIRMKELLKVSVCCACTTN